MGKVVFITVMCAFVATPVLADLTVQYSSVSPSMSMYVEGSSNSSIIGKWLAAGQYKIDVQGDTGDITGAPGIVNTFCIDLWDWVPASPLSYTLEPLDMTPDTGAGPMGPERAGYLATLLNRYWDQDNWSSDASRTFGSIVYSAEQVAAAVQLAVWEIVDEFNVDTTGPDGDTVVPDDWDVKEDLFRVSGDMVVQDIANAMLSSVAGIGPSSFGNYHGLSNSSDASHYQDYVVMTPIPPSVVLGLLGLGVVGLKLRKYA